MPSLVRQSLLMPFWLAQIFTQEKFFARNPVIGNRWLNEHGLHTARVTAACRLGAARPRRLGQLIAAEARAALDRDGFGVERRFLAPPAFPQPGPQIPRLPHPAAGR